MGSNTPATKNDIKKLENLFLDKFAIIEARLGRIQDTLSDIQAERENNPTNNGEATTEPSGRGDTVHSGGKQAYNYAGPVTFGEKAQLGGSQDVYHGNVDRSNGKTTYGDNTQVGGHRENKQLTNNLNGSTVTGENLHFGIGSVNQNKY